MADTSTDLKLREHLERRLTGLKAERTPYEPHWRDIASYCQARRSRFLVADGAIGGGDRQNKIHDPHAISSSGILAGGMTSGLTSPNRPWFKITTHDTDLAEAQGVKEWLDDVEKAIYAFLAGTNFYTSSKAGYAELGLFGTEASLMLEHRRYGGACHTMTAGEFWIALDDAGKPNTLYRIANMTVGQYAERFPQDRWSRFVKDKYDSSDYDTWVPVMHAIEPNNDRTPGRLDRRNKPWRSVYWERGSDGKKNNEGLIEVSGFDDQAFWAPRWDAMGANVYGNSPGMDALPDVKALQIMALRRLQAVDFLVKPALKGPPALANTFANLNPGGVTAVASSDDGSFGPVWKVDPNAITAMRAEANETKQSIDRLFFADLFMAITRMNGVQPRNIEEITARNEEKMTQLGPVVERVLDEKLKPVIDRAFGILLRTRQLPEPPEALQGVQLKIKFVSVLAQMQQLVGLGAIERTLGFVGNVIKAFPASADKIDADQMIDEYASIAGAPPRAIRSDEAVEQIRADRAQAEAAERAAQLAPVVKQAAEGAELLSRTDVGGGRSLLQQMSGGV